MPRTKKTSESIVKKPVVQKQQSTNLSVFVIAIIVTALFVGGIVFWGQQRIVNQNKEELEESNKKISQLTSQLNELQNVINQNIGNVNQIDGKKYYNTKHKFSITILKTWINSQTKERQLVLSSDSFDSVDLYFDETKPIFNIGMIDKDNWDGAQQLDYYKPIKIAEDDNYIFAFSFHKDADQTVIEHLREDIEQIVSTFRFEEIPQAEVSIENCAQENFSFKEGETKINIQAFNDQNINTKVTGCFHNNPEVLKTTPKYVYFAFRPEGVGGYILYGRYSGFYRTSLSDSKTEIIFTNSEEALILTDIDISSDVKFAVYRTTSAENNEFIVKNLDTMKDSKFKLPVSGSNMQFGNFKFSPDSSKIAIAIGYGPDKESGSVYVLDIADNKFSSYQTFDSKIPYIDSWKDNQTLNLR